MAPPPTEPKAPLNNAPAANKAVLAPFRAAMVDFEVGAVRAGLEAVIALDAILHMALPFGDPIKLRLGWTLNDKTAIWKTGFSADGLTAKNRGAG